MNTGEKLNTVSLTETAALQMKEEIMIITSREQLLNCLANIESIFNSFTSQVYMKLEVSKDLFEESLSL